MSFICEIPKENCARKDNLCCRACPQRTICDCECDEQDYDMPDIYIGATEVHDRAYPEDDIYWCENLTEGALVSTEVIAND